MSETTLPITANGGKSTRELVISILGAEWPLGAKEIYSRLKRAHGFGGSYQAAHKAIQQMEAEGILEKNGAGHQLSQKWVDGLNRQYSDLKTRLGGGARSIKDSGAIIFHSLFELDSFFLKLVESEAVPGERPDMFLYWFHLWIPLLISKKEYAQLVRVEELFRGHVICGNDNALDKWCAEFWSKRGTKVKLGVGEKMTDTVVFKDTVIQVFYPPEIRREMNEVYARTKKFSDLEIDYFFKGVFEKKIEIPVVITKNAQLAEQLGGEIRAYFGK